MYIIEVLGVVPHRDELSTFSMGYLSDCLFAKVIAGESRLDNIVKKVYVGAMSAAAVLATTLFKEPNKLVITAGDRSDMILAALETHSSGIVLTNNILPPSNIVSKASDMGVPVLLVSTDTYQVAKQIDELEPLLTKGATDKIDLLTRIISESVDLSKIS